MVPVRSVPTQPLLPSVLPIRLWPCEVNAPDTSEPLLKPMLEVVVFPAMIVFRTLTEPPLV
mgnify:CR=1 FL=1